MTVIGARMPKDIGLLIDEVPSVYPERLTVHCSVDRALVDHCRQNEHAAAMLWNRIAHELERAFVELLVKGEAPP